MIDVTISQDQMDKFVSEAEKRVVDSLVMAAKKNTSINSLVESAKARLTNSLQKELANKILESISIDKLIEDAVNLSESLVQEAIKKALADGLLFRIKMDNFKN